MIKTDSTTKALSFQSLGRKVGRLMLTLISILLVCMLILVGLLMAWSPGKPMPFVDENGNPVPGSISEKIRVSINGVEQGMFIKSKDGTNPVLLFEQSAHSPMFEEPEKVQQILLEDVLPGVNNLADNSRAPHN